MGVEYCGVVRPNLDGDMLSCDPLLGRNQTIRRDFLERAGT